MFRIFLLLVCCWAPTLAAQPFVIGKVSDNPSKHYGYLKPMADYLASNLTEFGYTEGKVLMARNNRQMVRYLKRHKVDLVTETIFSSVIFQDRAKAELLLNKWKKGQRDYESIIFARKDSGIDALADFKGKVIAFEDPGSTSAFFVPAAMLLKAGLTLEKLDSPRERPGAGNVGYVFSKEEINTSTWVHKKLVDIGALNDHDWSKSDHMPQNWRPDFKIIATSRRLPRQVEAVRPGMEQALKDKIKFLLLNIHLAPNADELLHSYQRTSRFEEFDDDIETTISYVRDLLALINKQLNE